ncbi:MAG: 2-C-methyl-D-erythritol 4-phosphate cytidylyltransferase [Candidatus Eisenbacteria bacterium]|uniref:2-C-methyl-D-erythritol 4-phosphate cytidylyltransferase n=1 Tax=Eiseniibacteriota bacterium TaxID=2212470 RepID=A0A538UD95_UNCEI|nr:MAG: 2-C-methyl-D-erythritol 4-phosphate cytidylyltransferase [Candidatus Eisenbacteria bacterium]
MSVTAILLCAGRGERLGASVQKALVPLAGRPLFTWSLEALERTAAVSHIVAVGPVKRMKELLAAAGMTPGKLVAWSEGGRERQDSVARGLRVLPEGTTLVAIHDCARAMVTPDLTARVIADALQHGAAIAAVAVADTLKRGALGSIETTVPRQGLWNAQTPQVFRRDWLEAAHAAAGRHATDDAALVEALGHRVHLTEGEALNFKITTAQDLELAEAWLTRTSART